jgi:hypothetical protein
VGPLGTSEQRKLGFQQDGWTLTAGNGPSTRTRTKGGGNRRPDIEGTTRKKEFIRHLSASASGSDYEQESSSEEEDSDEESTKDSSNKPPHSRAILEVRHIHDVFAELACPRCTGPIKVNLRTVCIASSLGLECLNKTCGYLFHAAPHATTSSHLARNDNFERSTEYVLGFMGCTEAARLLGLLELPNDTTMEGRSFTII